MLKITSKRRAVSLCAWTLCFAFATTSGRVLAIPYDGTPDLRLTVDLITAGSGPKGFDSHVLFANMYGKSMPAEAARLQAHYGAAAVANFFPLMDFTVADVVKMVNRDHVALPAAHDPLQPVRLDRSMYLVGHSPNGSYDVGYMIERLISHKYHHELMMDLDRHFTHRQVASFHSVLGSVVQDTAKVPS